MPIGGGVDRPGRMDVRAEQLAAGHALLPLEGLGRVVARIEHRRDPRVQVGAQVALRIGKAELPGRPSAQTHVGVAVDQSRQQRGAAPVDHRSPVGRREAATDPDGGDATPGNQDVAVALDATRLHVQQLHVLDQDLFGTRVGPAHQLRRSRPAGEAQHGQGQHRATQRGSLSPESPGPLNSVRSHGFLLDRTASGCRGGRHRSHLAGIGQPSFFSSNSSM
jgi:hypothetical protein